MRHQTSSPLVRTRLFRIHIWEHQRRRPGRWLLQWTDDRRSDVTPALLTSSSRAGRAETLPEHWRFGSVGAPVASGLALRYDGGSCFRSDHYQTEINHLGISRSPAFHYEPETNGCAEKAIQTLKEQVLWIERFETLEQLRTAVRAFGRTYNDSWLIERHGFRTPIEAREHLIRQAAMAWSLCSPRCPVDRARRTSRKTSRQDRTQRITGRSTYKRNSATTRC